ncbi:hypothetical protein CABS01_15560 [Colletotrichum abscissum]|uniref:uncharacterized protein n=1 Tax=Colletotrichum abscissum TaxID=1671311 RepID=UPI0027D5A804|nr:uncharacterized protein CABS01_15560 [Colletotrichum abscissum]KAK1475854.1 hypothetical protein CABS01_15560 [Colletotrichum abscissum]
MCIGPTAGRLVGAQNGTRTTSLPSPQVHWGFSSAPDLRETQPAPGSSWPALHPLLTGVDVVDVVVVICKDDMNSYVRKEVSIIASSARWAVMCRYISVDNHTGWGPNLTRPKCTCPVESFPKDDFRQSRFVAFVPTWAMLAIPINVRS